MRTASTPIERLLRRQRLIVVVVLAVITALSWWWVVSGAGTGMSVAAMTTWTFPPPAHAPVLVEWSFTYAVVMLLMWWVMMVAMMTPSAAPTILLYAHAHRYEQRLGRISASTAAAPTLAFALGYLAVWLGFSLLATGLQWGLERAGLMHAMFMWSIDPLLTGALLVAAGLYQLTPLKSICLRHCRSPAQFLAANYRPGSVGALRMGMVHGAFCLGCCWLLMALLFAAGIMNLLWIAGLAAVVLVEKLLPHGLLFARASGIALAASGIWILARSLLA